MRKKNLLVLSPGPNYQPNSRLLLGRYEMLSESFNGFILTSVADIKYSDMRIGEFYFRAMVTNKRGSIMRLKLLFFMIREALKFNKKEKIDCIICYEPMFTGFIGAILKIFLKCKLIIEINNTNFDKALKYEQGNNLKTKIKSFLTSILRRISISNADGIKLLTDNVVYDDKNLINKRKFIFHDFVPTEFFRGAASRVDKYVLFVGFPFYRKGIDILIKAFDKISQEFPDFKLKLVGHQLYEEALKLDLCGNPNIEFIKPMFYDDLKKVFKNCYCFVLPSREEGMGRVIIEAMASGKAIIGSDTGGIPALVKDGENGFLFEPENVDSLSHKMRLLLSDSDLAKKMGIQACKLVEEKYSAKKYFYCFKNMVNEIIGKGASVDDKQD